MTWLIVAYVLVSYYYFRMVLRCLTAWDTTDTVLLNASLALIIGPLVLMPLMLYHAAWRGFDWIVDDTHDRAKL